MNILGVRTGALVQNIFTTAKVLGSDRIDCRGLHRRLGLGRDQRELRAVFWQNAGFWDLHPVQVGRRRVDRVRGVFAILAVVQVGSLFAADAWNNVTFTAAEVKNPQRNLPLALALGAGGVILLYVLANLTYLMALPLDQIKTAAEDRVGTAVLEHAFAGSGAKWMALAIMVSTFGCVNGMVLAGARVYYAMSEDGLFFKNVGKIHPRFKTPATSLLLQGVWASVLCVSGSYGQLLDYIIFAALLFYILTIAAIFILRRTRPMRRGLIARLDIRFLPAIYIAMAIFIDAVLLRYKPQYTWPGLLIVCTGDSGLFRLD